MTKEDEKGLLGETSAITEMTSPRCVGLMHGGGAGVGSIEKREKQPWQPPCVTLNAELSKESQLYDPVGPESVDISVDPI